MKCYNLLLILFVIALKCGAERAPTTVNNFTVENVKNCDVFNASVTTPGNRSDINSTSEPNVFGRNLINASDDNDVEVKKIEFGLPISRNLTQQETVVKSIVGSGLIEPNETGAKEDAGVYDVATTVKYSTVANITNSEVSNASTTEAPENSSNRWFKLPNIISLSESSVGKNTFINATAIKTVSPFKTKKFGKLPIPLRLLLQKGIRTVTNIIGSLKKGLAKLNNPDSDDEADDEEQIFGNYSTEGNDTNCSVVSSASTTEGMPPNMNSSSESPVSKNILINATGVLTVSPFKKKEFGKLSIPWRMPQYRRNRIVTNIRGNLLKMLAQLNELDSEEDLGANVELTNESYITVDNVTNIEVFNASTIKAPENSITVPFVPENILINATNGNTGGSFKIKRVL